jgi:hypothetical protein
MVTDDSGVEAFVGGPGFVRKVRTSSGGNGTATKGYGPASSVSRAARSSAPGVQAAAAALART